MTQICGDMLLDGTDNETLLRAGQQISVNLPFTNVQTVKGVVDADVWIVRGRDYRVTIMAPHTVTFDGNGRFRVQRRIRLSPCC